MKRREIVTVSALAFSIGIVLGFLISPVKKGIDIGNNSGNTVNNYYDKKQSNGIRYDDPILNIKWPIKPKIISPQDKSWPLLKK